MQLRGSSFSVADKWSNVNSSPLPVELCVQSFKSICRNCYSNVITLGRDSWLFVQKFLLQADMVGRPMISWLVDVITWSLIWVAFQTVHTVRIVFKLGYVFYGFWTPKYLWELEMLNNVEDAIEVNANGTYRSPSIFLGYLGFFPGLEFP